MIHLLKSLTTVCLILIWIGFISIGVAAFIEIPQAKYPTELAGLLWAGLFFTMFPTVLVSFAAYALWNPDEII